MENVDKVNEFMEELGLYAEEKYFVTKMLNEQAWEEWQSETDDYDEDDDVDIEDEELEADLPIRNDQEQFDDETDEEKRKAINEIMN